MNKIQIFSAVFYVFSEFCGHKNEGLDIVDEEVKNLIIYLGTGLAYPGQCYTSSGQLSTKTETLQWIVYTIARNHIGHCLGNMAKSWKYANPGVEPAGANGFQLSSHSAVHAGLFEYFLGSFFKISMSLAA